MLRTAVSYSNRHRNWVQHEVQIKSDAKRAEADGFRQVYTARSTLQCTLMEKELGQIRIHFDACLAFTNGIDELRVVSEALSPPYTMTNIRAAS